MNVDFYWLGFFFALFSLWDTQCKFTWGSWKSDSSWNDVESGTILIQKEISLSVNNQESAPVKLKPRWHLTFYLKEEKANACSHYVANS